MRGNKIVQHKRQATRVAVIGLGLIGGSIAAALRAADGWYVTGMDCNPDSGHHALDNEIIDELADDLATVCKNADLIVLATPVSVILSDLKELATLAPDGATIIDVGSTKRAINQAMNDLPDRLRAVGGHPMAGKRTAGVAGATRHLFERRKFVLVPNRRTDAEALEIAWRLVKDLGAIGIEMDAETHDKTVAMISHVPHYLSVALLQATQQMGDPEPWQLAAGGFRSATSMATENLAMWRDIGASNGDSIARSLRLLSTELESMANMLETSDRDAIAELLSDAAKLYNDQLT